MKVVKFACLALLLFRLSSTTVSSQTCNILDAEIAVVGHEQPNPQLTGQAPFVVNVDGLASCTGVGSHLTARYLWDFGDPNSAHNTIEGWGGGHVYDIPGEYTLSLTLINEDRVTDVQEISVVVIEDAKQNIFVSSNGNDANDGGSEANAIQSIARVMQLIASNQRLNFYAGDTMQFTEANRILIENFSNIHITKYGEGLDPVFMAPPQGESGQGGMVEIFNGATQIVIENIRFLGPAPLTGLNPQALSAVTTGSNGVTNVAIRNNYFHNVSNGANTGAQTEQARGLYIADNDAGSLGLYLLYGSGSNHTVIGNTMLESVDAHSVRFYASRMFVYKNDLASHDNSTSISAAGGAFAYIRGNTVRHPMRASYIAVDGPSIYTDVVFEANQIVREPDLTDPYVPSLWIFPNSENIMIRNNVFLGQNTVSIRLGGDDIGELDEVFVLNNTSLSASDDAGFIETFVHAVRDNGRIVVANNLVIQPNFMGGRYNGDSNPFMNNLAVDLTGYTFANNVWQHSLPGTGGASGNPHRISQLSVSAENWDALSQTSNEIYGSYTLADVSAPEYRPPSQTMADGHAEYLPGVLADFHGNARPETNLTAGAVEINSTVAVQDEDIQLLQSVSLEQNYPNPFNPETSIRFTLSKAMQVHFWVFNTRGQQVFSRNLGFKNAGEHQLVFKGEGLPSGLYFYQIKYERGITSKRMILMK